MRGFWWIGGTSWSRKVKVYVKVYSLLSNGPTNYFKLIRHFWNSANPWPLGSGARPPFSQDSLAESAVEQSLYSILNGTLEDRMSPVITVRVNQSDVQDAPWSVRRSQVVW